jgi:hypothetical protein
MGGAEVTVFSTSPAKVKDATAPGAHKFGVIKKVKDLGRTLAGSMIGGILRNAGDAGLLRSQ